MNNKHYYPIKRKNHYNVKNKNKLNIISMQNPSNLFNGTIVDNMKFGNQEHELSGYVKREIIIQDRNGNKQVAREVQFFNSGKNINVRINDNTKDVY